jgi:phenylacetate-CoA ligase
MAGISGSADVARDPAPGIPDGVPAASERLRERAAAELAARLPEHLSRLGWDRARLAAHQRDRLRQLLAHAAAHSPFHARRLAGIDAERFEVADLPRLPVMTKAGMMAEFDDVVTDRRLSLRRVQAHLDASKTRASLLLGEYVCLASGGSSGLRGVFVQTVAEYMDFMASFMRAGAARSSPGGARPGSPVLAVVAAASPVHSSGLASATIGAPVRLVPVPATLPLGEIVRRLNALQPPAVTGYPTMLALLAAEQRAGRLRIAPAAVTASSEMLTGEARAAITAAFGVPVTDQFASTEGLVGPSEPGGRVQTFATDMCIVELLDAAGQPVPPGAAAAKVLLTNLHNFTQPLIRYELADRFVRHEDDQGGRLRATVAGRTDSLFRYGGIAVHPVIFAEALDGMPGVGEYQVRQTRRGAAIDVVAGGELDEAALRDAVRRGLARCGVESPEVTVRAVTSIERHPETGKTLRFLPAALARQTS